MTLVTGLVAGWTSPFIAKLDVTKHPDSELPINETEASWIASLINISRAGGSILSAIFIYLIGTKSTTLVSGIPLAIGWICFFIINSVTLVYVSRILCGIGIGMYYSSFSLYIGEMSHPKIRGALITFNIQGFLMGHLCGNIMGKYFKMWLFAAVSLVFNVIFMVSFSMMPHTPHYLIRCNKMDKAVKSMSFYNRTADATNEFKALEQFLRAHPSHSFWDEFRSLSKPINWKTLLMISIITVCTQLDGPYAFSAYMEIIVTKARLDIMKPSDLIIGVSVIGIVSSWLSI
ncbi:facilitated trehalose transporter Tret1-like [Cotesia typhae]|uniref:facilitated trehalose transporter Tret1-like n=1 Tax=Cotesia typhae TaxID=2053667 RepID=UPI003D688DF0